MRTWKNAKVVVALTVLAWGCGMAESSVFQPKPLENLKQVQASEDSRKLDAEVTAFLRGKYAIVSARYYQAPGEIPWIAISKSVQNQMEAKKIHRTMFDWYEPGLDFVEVYPAGRNGSAFAVAMPKDTRSDAAKLIGFYVLGAPSAEKK